MHCSSSEQWLTCNIRWSLMNEAIVRHLTQCFSCWISFIFGRYVVLRVLILSAGKNSAGFIAKWSLTHSLLYAIKSILKLMDLCLCCSHIPENINYNYILAGPHPAQIPTHNFPWQKLNSRLCALEALKYRALLPVLARKIPVYLLLPRCRTDDGIIILFSGCACHSIPEC